MDIDEYNDIAGVSGVESIALALKHRWETEYGELTYHPEYGSKLKQILKTSQPYTNKLLEIELIETALQDHRIVDLTINSMTKDKDAIYVDCIAKVSGQYKEANFKLTVYA
jgi:phage baseplate assembly protein W